jgi:hypothetical protein
MNRQVRDITATALAVAPSIAVKKLPIKRLSDLARDCLVKQHGLPLHAVQIDARIIVNYIRHELTPYDGLMTKTREKISKASFEQRDIYRRAALFAIAGEYASEPLIVQECHRQLEAIEKETDLRKRGKYVWRAPS